MRYEIPIKQRNREIFLALQSDAKSYPKGGILGLGMALNLDGRTLANQLNPDNETRPPTFETIIRMIDLLQAKQSVFTLCQLTNQVPMDLDLSGFAKEEDQIKLFLSMVQSISQTLGKCSSAAKDGRFDSLERKEITPLLLNLMQITAQLYHSFNE